MHTLDRENSALAITMAHQLKKLAIGTVAIVAFVLASTSAYADGGLRIRAWESFTKTLTDAPVIVKDKDGKVVSPDDAKTDQTGRYGLDDLPAGEYTVEIQDGSDNGVKKITVADGPAPTRSTRIEIGDKADSSSASAAQTDQNRISASFGPAVSRVENNSTFGIGTVVIGASENFIARTDDDITRIGFDAKASFSLGTSLFLNEGKGSLIGGLSYAKGSDNDFGTATVGEGGVNQVAVTFLREDGGLGTGVSSNTAGDILQGSASVDNSWSLANFGYRESFHPNGPEGLKVQFGGAVVFEQFDNDFHADVDILRGGDSLAHQSTSININDRYYGYEMMAGLAQKFCEGKFRLGVQGFLTPSLHRAEGTIHQNTIFGGGVNQSLEYSESGFALSAGARFKGSVRMGDMGSLSLGYEYSVLGGATHAEIPASPTLQPATFKEDNVQRHFVAAKYRLRF